MKRSGKLFLIGQVARDEFHAIRTSYAVILLLIGGIFVYGLLYNYMYAPNQVTGAKVVVVDHSHSFMSREYSRLLGATPQVAIHSYAADFNEARELLRKQEVVGILYLPYDFESRIRRGEESVFVLYATTSAFLYYLSLQEASSYVMLELNERYRTDGIVFLPLQGLLAVAMSQPVTVVGTPVYNYTEGYGSYLIPGVMMIILFQTLTMLIGLRTGEEYEEHQLSAYSATGSFGVAWAIVSGKTFVWFAIYAVFALFLLGLLPHFFSIPNIGNGFYILQMMIPFLLGTCFLGLSASWFFKDSEAPLLMIAFFSVGLLFLSGISYPLELMPWYWRGVHYLLPVTTGTLAYIKLNSMGADLADIRPELVSLWVQVVFYFLLSLWVYRMKLKRVSTMLATLRNKPIKTCGCYLLNNKQNENEENHPISRL